MAVGDEIDRRRAVKRARSAGLTEQPQHRCAHCAHCVHCEECPFRLDLDERSGPHQTNKPLVRLVLERIDKYYVIMGALCGFGGLGVGVRGGVVSGVGVRVGG